MAAAHLGEQQHPENVNNNDNHFDEFQFMTIQDVEYGEPQFYDAIVCHSEDDLQFAEDLVLRYESEHGMRMCLADKDILPGSSTYTVTAELIATRCNKMVAVISPSFLQSEQCDFQLKFAHALSPGYRAQKIIPLIKDRCELPHILKPVTCADLTRQYSLPSTWRKLTMSLRHPSRPPVMEERERLRRVPFTRR